MKHGRVVCMSKNREIRRNEKKYRNGIISVFQRLDWKDNVAVKLETEQLL